MKKIAVLTLPLHTNYGGNLQAYALCKILESMGYHVDLLNIVNKDNTLKGINYLLYTLKQIVKKNIFSKKPAYIFNSSEFNYIRRHHLSFINRINKTEPIYDLNDFDEINDYDVVLVGSDQVWRKLYTPNVNNYFLNFIKNDRVKKVAFAASFGLEEWQYSDEETKNLISLVKSFYYISVREDTAVKLCQKYLNVQVDHVLDPTLLLSKEHYLNNFELKPTENKGNIFNYILDENNDKSDIVKKVSYRLDKEVFSLRMFNAKKEAFVKNLDDYVIPSIEEWIKAFDDADFIITDSFHGMIFSIIFNKQFLVIGNKERGLTRFQSILKFLDLETRLVYADNFNLNKLLDEKINFDTVNLKIQNEKLKNLDKLNSVISNKI